MHYYGAVYRPPSEAYSLIVQCTLGCSHNKCAFCNMYKDKKFSIRPVEEVLRDLAEARSYERRLPIQIGLTKCSRLVSARITT